MSQSHYNPFIFEAPIQDPAFFFERDQERQMILNTISHTIADLRQSMAIVGPSRIGKSSLLIQLIQRLSTTNPITALIRTRQFDIPSLRLLAQTILSELRESAQTNQVAAGDVRFNLLDHPAPPDDEVLLVLRRDLKRLNDRLALTQQPPAIIMIDDVEGLIEFGGLHVLGMVRDLAQSLPYVMLIVAGSDRLYELMVDDTSPFLNGFKTISLEPFTEADTRTMIMKLTRPARLLLQEEAIDRIVQSSGGVPYLINMIGHYATEMVLGDTLPVVTLQCVNRAIRYILNHKQEFCLDIWQRTIEPEKFILYALVKTGRPILLNDIVDNLRPISKFTQPKDQIHALIKRLLQRQILRVNNAGEYAFTNQLIPMWIQHHCIQVEVLKEVDPTPQIAGNDPKLDEIANLEEMYLMLRQKLHTLQLQAAKFGDLHLPYHVALEIQDTQTELANLEKKISIMRENLNLSVQETPNIAGDEAHQRALLLVYQDKLQILTQQSARYGSHAPPSLLNELEETKIKIQQLNASLAMLIRRRKGYHE